MMSIIKDRPALGGSRKSKR